jgi:uncharacterized protein YlzI (FlbEa/FlbD family)
MRLRHSPVLEFLILMLLDGREAYVNPRQIASITEAKNSDEPGRHYTDKVKCVISMADGKIFSVAEECDSIEQRLRKIIEKRIEEMRK